MDYKSLKDAIVFNQLIVLLLYVIPKEKKWNRRKEILKKYNELVSEYKIRQNHIFWTFLQNPAFSSLQNRTHVLF